MLAQADVVVPIPGAWRPPSIQDSSATANLVLTTEEVTHVDAALSNP